jgi:hypothetical protein
MVEGRPSLLRRERPRRTEARLTLLDSFDVRCEGRIVELPTPAQRLLAYLAIEDRPLQRGYLAGALWLDATEARASGSLRSALWRIRRSGCDLVEQTNHQLRLAQTVAVDVHEAYSWAARVQDPARPIGAADVGEASAVESRNRNSVPLEPDQLHARPKVGYADRRIGRSRLNSAHGSLPGRCPSTLQSAARASLERHGDVNGCEGSTTSRMALASQKPP